MLTPQTRRAFDQRVRLIAVRCADCGRLAFPPRGRCVECGGARFTAAPLTRAGVLENFAIRRDAGDPTNPPRAFGIVRLDDGPRIACPLTGDAARRPKAGMRVILVVRRWRSSAPGDGVSYGYAAARAHCIGADDEKDERRE